ncbi:MAG: SGNH/GDSL hydrolase family protein [Proteobacteria bacterium]|nr:SGNH/GDSL hydrolase family protein [Pseudomonadota bacterium]
MIWAAAATALLAACGGGGDGDQSPAVHYSKLVVFGDSLSDVGSYATPGIVAQGGGKYTVNGSGAMIWVERLAAQIQVTAPCAAETGLDASGPFAALAAPATTHADCYDYAQGGSRVTDPIGVANAAVLPGDTSGYLGQLTVPVVTQMQNHLAAVGGSYAGDELVTVLAGGNDLFVNLATLSATVMAGGDPTAAATAAVTAMATAGGQLAGYVQSLVLAKGATHVVVVNLPDVGKTPFALSQDAQTQGLIEQMNQAFNDQLATGLSGVAGVLLVDLYTQSGNQAANPALYALTNITDTACDLTKTPIGSLTCSDATVIAGDISHYAYADTVHPTPYGYELIAEFVAQQLLVAGWL